ncbi:hypothetical protein BTM25_51390 [Actinomadura rubteroloni]|uniref:Uncharacterized protein n=1 Tax=Actinomadura rubteroloni TaxID=1926885 RepID=A0A2P4UD04_9ACTN|nr:hypothetical protein [Actinomadura rubteroloni]POM22933.1 hypothetical protein BTM25_51390 [Actinomadura rubteroloni]
MPVSRPARDRCREFLGVGDGIRYLFPAAARGGGAGYFFVVTDDQISVLTTGGIGREKPKSVWGTYPRESRIGPVRPGDGVFEFDGSYFEIDDQYVPVVNAADAEAFEPDSLPRDPLPDL